MSTKDGAAPVLTIDEAVELYFDLLQQSKGLEQQVRFLRDRILQSISSQRIDHLVVDGLEVERQVRHHPPQLNEDRAVQILAQHGRLEECQVEVLDQEKARAVIDELFRHGAISKDELPYIYVKPTQALVVRRVELPAAAEREERPARRAA
ncbi:MAG: hypothetical protein ACM3US_05155 [Sphingomonadaceae bacterium]